MSLPGGGAGLGCAGQTAAPASHESCRESGHKSSYESSYEYLHLLSILTLAPSATREQALGCLDELDNDDWLALSEAASSHHVVLRVFETGEMAAAPARRAATLKADDGPVVVIKSFDHWPDLGDDLDLLTLADVAACAMPRALARDHVPVSNSQSFHGETAYVCC